MKKLLSVLIVTAMISANASIAMAKGNEKSNSTKIALTDVVRCK
ncbi:hypothetical protein [Petroclostridium xylanilyticum]|nr:hypothetical protein [Petroclostridium xylanilyticum]